MTRLKISIVRRYARLSKLAVLAVLALAMIAGCHSSATPRRRLGAYFGAPLGIPFPHHERLGKHGYTNSMSERIGLVYTCRGGFIDMGHLREAADRTAYISKITFENLMKGETTFSFRVLEPSEYFVTISYPDNWEELPDKEVIAMDTAIRLGQYLAYMATIWHEIVTWYGYKCTGVFSEYISSFSWEDTYSNILGTELGARALRTYNDDFDDAMTTLIREELEKLDAQRPGIGMRATRKVEGKWYKGGLYFFVIMQKRNFDVGLDDGVVTPWLVPDICPDCEALPYAVPTTEFLSDYGMSFELQVEPRILESDRLLRTIYPNGEGSRVQPGVHFPVIIKHIRNEAIEKYGAEVDVPKL
jgi:hypothetical protein